MLYFLPDFHINLNKNVGVVVKRLRVGVIYGGRSGEHEVSLASAAAILTHLDPDRYELIPICINKDGSWSLVDKPPSSISAAEIIEKSKLLSPSSSAQSGWSRSIHFLASPGESQLLTVQPQKNLREENYRATIDAHGIDVCFPVVHGPFGEDGTLQGLFELANVAYVGSGVLGSAVSMDKAIAKSLFATNGLPIVKHKVMISTEWKNDRVNLLKEIEKSLRYPIFTKPANLGSSVGISKATDTDSLIEGIELAGRYDHKIVIEEAVVNAREFECGVIGNEQPETSVVGEVIPTRDFYDYEAKYLDDSSVIVIPASLDVEKIKQVQSMAREGFRTVDANGMARVDFLMNPETKDLYINEINTIPGFTNISMFTKLWEKSGLQYSKLLDRLIELALERHTLKQTHLDHLV